MKDLKHIKKISVEDIHIDSKKLEVFLFNVGQGDHILLKFPSKIYGIIDFYYDQSEYIAEPPCLSYFRELKKKLPEKEFKKITISFLCISHPDKDHLKGISEVIKWFHDNEIFIRDFWLPAAENKLQLENFLKVKVNSLIEEFTIDESFRYDPDISEFKEGVRLFFDYFDKWRNGEFQSERYQNDPRGIGSYLVDIKPLSYPSLSHSDYAINMGPLKTQVDTYIKYLHLDSIKEILKINDKKNRPDNNLISHILRIKFGEKNLLFGGDTHKDIWEECLKTYENPVYPYFRDFGDFKSHFIKVSHHGSVNSSSLDIWKKIIPPSDLGDVYLGISAGRHNRYKHPHSDTLREIREVRNDSNILSTNVCMGCLQLLGFTMEHHKWYDDFVKKTPDEYENEANKWLKETTTSEPFEKVKENPLGLFAYIVEVPSNQKDQIKVRLALTEVNKSYECFYKEHQEKLRDFCE